MLLELITKDIEFSNHEYLIWTIFVIGSASIILYYNFKQFLNIVFHYDKTSKIYHLSILSRLCSLICAILFLETSLDSLFKLKLRKYFIMEFIDTLWTSVFSLWVVFILQISYSTIRFIETNLSYQMNFYMALICYIPSEICVISTIAYAIVYTIKEVEKKPATIYSLYIYGLTGVINMSAALILLYFLVKLFKMVESNSYTKNKTGRMIFKWKIFIFSLLMFNILYDLLTVVAIEMKVDELVKQLEVEKNPTSATSKTKPSVPLKKLDPVLERGKQPKKASKIRMYSIILRIAGGFIQLYFNTMHRATKRKNKCRKM